MPTAWIVDDDDDMGQAIKLMLELLEYQVEVHKSAPSAARRLLLGNIPDVIVLDILMPGVSGIDMLEFLRKERELEDIPVVMLSSETTDVQVDEAMEQGADGFVFKPVMIDELESALKEAMAAHGGSPKG